MYQTSKGERAATLAVALALAAATQLAAQERAADAQKRPATADHENSLTASQVPVAVRAAFRHAYPHATVLKYSSEVENGKTIYEISSRDGTTLRDLDIGADGTIIETETQIPAAQLPAAVRTAAEAGGAHIQLAERVVAGNETTYELKIRGRRGELTFYPDGRPVPAPAPAPARP
jgi:hypothetical protein